MELGFRPHLADVADDLVKLAIRRSLAMAVEHVASA
jgi:hypothetical protein